MFVDDTARKRARDLQVAVGLEHRLDAPPALLSGGERERVGIARVLMNPPKVLLADEPPATLDPERGRASMEPPTEQATLSGASTLVVTHVTHVIEQIAPTRRLLVEDGSLCEYGLD